MNKKNKKESENEYPSIEEENRIIEEIIKNQIIKGTNLDKGYEDFEEEENEEDILEKDKITEEILDNKFSFIVPEEEEKIEEEINQRKIQKIVIEDLLIELFEYHYNGMIGQKRKNPQSRVFATKYNIEFYYTKLNINFIKFSKYILLILEQKIEELIEYIKKKISKQKLSVKDILDIKKSLCLVGINIGKIFERAFENTKKFDISSVLEVLFITEILNDNDIDISDQEYEEIINISKLDEKDNFEKYVDECKSYFEKLENGEKDEEDLDVEVEEEKINENTDAKINENQIEEMNNKNNENHIDKKEENHNENINKINIEKEEKNNQDMDINNKIKILIEKNESLTVEDLLKYINGNDNKKKKKKKRRKKKKIEENKNINNINIQIEEKDGVVENFKSYIIDSYENIDKNQKIKPNLSQAFLDKLIVLSN